MKQAILFAVLICAVHLARAQTPTPPPGVVETYKVVNGMNIRATVYNVDDGTRHRVAIVIHGGGFDSGVMQTSVAQELSQYGFMGVAIEYRLAPPHTEMNTPAHPFPGQNNIDDNGHYPEQTDDVGDAIIHYRNDPRSNGQVVLVGGSAGGSHSLYLAATGTPGYDMPDLAVILSCGASNLADPNQYALVCVNGEVCPAQAVTNYLNIPDSAPNPPVGSDLTLAQEASPTHWMHVGMCPFWAMCSSKDSLGIPTATGFNIHSYLPDNMPGVLENGENGIVPRALAIGLTESTSNQPEAGSFKATIVPVSVHEHSFDYWDQVKGEVIPWISAPIGSIPPASIKVPSDFNNDGYSDSVLYNSSTGQTVIYYMNNNVLISSTYGPTVPSGWQIAAVGDFNLDGHPDYLLFNPATSQTVIYYMNNNILTASTYGPTLASGWTVAGVADFNLDGYPDYLLYNSSTGQTMIYYMNNNVLIGSASGPTIPSGWQIAALGDFDRDGHPDYLLFNPATGQTVIYYMNNKTLTASTYGPTLPGGWTVAGVAPFNLDGYPDYLLYNATTGGTVIWYMNDNVQIGSTSGPTVPGGWIPVAP